VLQLTVNYQRHGAIPQVDLKDFKFTKYDHYNARLQSDFGMDIEGTESGELHCTFDFDTSLYDVEGMKDFAQRYEALLRNAVESNGQSVLAPSMSTLPQINALRRHFYSQFIRISRACLNWISNCSMPCLTELPPRRHPSQLSLRMNEPYI
jgi:hypothetical protein